MIAEELRRVLIGCKAKRGVCHAGPAAPRRQLQLIVVGRHDRLADRDALGDDSHRTFSDRKDARVDEVHNRRRVVDVKPTLDMIDVLVEIPCRSG